MPRALLLALALVLVACVPPDDDAPADLLPDPAEAAPASGFDATRWVAEVAALDTLRDLDERDARSRDLAHQLDAVTAWTLECDIDEPAGQLYLHDLGDGRYLAEAICFLGAYQANAVLVALAGDEVHVLTVPRYDETGALAEPGARTIGGYVVRDTLDAPRESGTFEVVSLARGAGGCGVWARYRLVGDRAEPVRVQARSCEAACEAADCLEPSRWPLVFPLAPDSVS